MAIECQITADNILSKRTPELLQGGNNFIVNHFLLSPRKAARLARFTLMEDIFGLALDIYI